MKLNLAPPGISWNDFSEGPEMSRGTLLTAVKRIVERGEEIGGQVATWVSVSNRWNVDLNWLVKGEGQPRPGMEVPESALAGLAARTFADEDRRGGSPAKVIVGPKEAPPNPRRGPAMPHEFRHDVAVLVLARRKRTGDRFTKDEVWAGFRSMRLLHADDATDERKVANAVIAAIEGDDEPLAPRKTAKVPRRAP